MRLEIAAGDRPTPGYLHHDARALPDIEIVCDMWDLPDHVSERFETVRATHILEHFSHLDTGKVLSLWHDLVQPGGSVYIEVPNLMWQARALCGEAQTDETEEGIVTLMYGGQDYPGNFHCTGFTEGTLERALRTAGFTNVYVQDIGMVLCAGGTR